MSSESMRRWHELEDDASRATIVIQKLTSKKEELAAALPRGTESMPRRHAAPLAPLLADAPLSPHRCAAAPPAHESLSPIDAPAPPGCSELHFCNGLAFTFVRKVGVGLSYETGHGFCIRKIMTGAQADRRAGSPLQGSQDISLHDPPCQPQRRTQTTLPAAPPPPPPHSLPTGVHACHECARGAAGQHGEGGRPTWTWSAPLFLTVSAAGLGLTLGYTEIGECVGQWVVGRVGGGGLGSGCLCHQGIGDLYSLITPLRHVSTTRPPTRLPAHHLCRIRDCAGHARGGAELHQVAVVGERGVQGGVALPAPSRRLLARPDRPSVPCPVPPRPALP